MAQCARLMSHLLPGRFRWLPVEHPALALGHPGDFDASRLDTRNHHGPHAPRLAGCALESGASTGALRNSWPAVYVSVPNPETQRQQEK